MKDDAGRPKSDSRRLRRRGGAGADGVGADGSGWLAAQFQATGDTEQGDRHDDADATGPRRGTAHPDASGVATPPSATPPSPEPRSPEPTSTEPPQAGGFRWALKPQASPATQPSTHPAPLPAPPTPEPMARREPPARPVPDPAARPLSGSADDPFLPADPHAPIVAPGLPAVPPPAMPPPASTPVPTASLSDSFVVPPPDRVLPLDLFSPVQPGEATEPLISRRTFRPRVLADPDLPGSGAAPVPLTPADAASALTAPLTPATAHRENEDSPLAALFRERERHLPPAEPSVRRPSVPLISGSLPTASGPGAPPSKVSGSGWSGNKKLLFWGGGAVLAVLALIGLFFLGTRLPELFGSAPAPASDTTTAVSVSPSATPSATPTPSPSTPPVTEVAAVGPLAPGTYSWEKLRGGECLSGYESPWAEKFSVVDCAVPHPAQMVHRGAFGPDDASVYPGLDALQAQINLLCSAPTVIDFAAAGAYNDIRVAGSFAATSQEWDAGHRDYFCFVTRGSGEPLAGSVAAPVS